MRFRAKHNPDTYCPICGRAVKGDDGPAYLKAWADHRCPERTLRGIDAAHGRDPDSETARDWKPEAERLAEGLRMLDWE